MLRAVSAKLDTDHRRMDSVLISDVFSSEFLAADHYHDHHSSKAVWGPRDWASVICMKHCPHCALYRLQRRLSKFNRHLLTHHLEEPSLRQ